MVNSVPETQRMLLTFLNHQFYNKSNFQPLTALTLSHSHPYYKMSEPVVSLTCSWIFRKQEKH